MRKKVISFLAMMLVFVTPIFAEGVESLKVVTKDGTPGIQLALSDVQKITVGETGIKVIPKASSAAQPEYFYSNLMKIKLGEMEPAGKKGDVNGDGSVDVSDVNIVINIVLGNDDAANYGGRADVTGDGIVDVSDVNTIINIVLGGQ